MRHNERMNSRSARGVRQKGNRAREEKGWGYYKCKNMFQPVETALSANWPESNNPRVLFLSPVLPWPTKENVNKLAIADRNKPFQRAQNNKANLSVSGTSLTRTVEREWHFRAGSLSVKTPHTSSKDTPEWNMGELDKLAFLLALPGGGLIYILCVILHRSHYHPFVTDAYLFIIAVKMAICTLCKVFNILKWVQIVYNKKQWHIFSAFRLTTSSSFVPFSPLCLSVKRRGER